jgi:uncharacterized protein
VNLQYIMSIEVDRLLFSWRQLARRSQPAGIKAYSSGWEHPGSELRGHFLGHWLSAAAFAWAASGSATLFARMGVVVAELEACSNALEGWLSAFPTSHLDRFESLAPVWVRRDRSTPGGAQHLDAHVFCSILRPYGALQLKPASAWQAPYYSIHKVMQGLLDQDRIVGDSRALRIVRRMADVIEVRVTKLIASRKMPHHWETLNMEYGGAVAPRELAVCACVHGVPHM